MVFDEDAENEEDEEDGENEEYIDSSVGREKYLINNVPNLETDDWIAVAFPRGWYPGQSMRYRDESKEECVNFLEKTSSTCTTSSGRHWKRIKVGWTKVRGFSQSYFMNFS